MKAPAALGYFRQISCLGLGARDAVTAMLAEMPGIVPGARAMLSWTKPDGSPTDLCLPEILPSVIDLFLNQHDLFLGPSEPSLEVCAVAPGPFLVWDRYAGLKDASHTYNEVFRPYRMEHMLSAPVQRSGKPIGLFAAFRGPGDRPLSAEDVAMLTSLVPYLRHAMLARDETWPLVESAERGAIVCRPDGRILSQSATARRLLTYAAIGGLGLSATTADIPASVLPDAVMPVCAALVEIARGRPAPPPRLTIRNPWGVFEVAAEALADETAPGIEPDTICVTIQRRQPLPLRLAARLRDQPLSDRQRQVALHLALDRPVDDILSRMGIGAHTYRDHVRAVYAGLDVSNRAQLLGRLLS